jgi:lipid A 4'-phosphatase
MTPAPTKTPWDTRLLWAGLLCAMAIFSLWPGLDLCVAHMLYTPEQGFVHAKNPMVLASYNWTRPIGLAILNFLARVSVLAIVSPLVAYLMCRLGYKKIARHLLSSWRSVAIVSVLCGVLGPGFLVEVCLKNTIGRPRPIQVIEFGGDQTFQAIFQMGTDPEHHRSFVSSHAAAGFWLTSLGLSLGTKWRRRWLLIGLVVGSAIGIGRMMQGGHFLSDIIFAFYSVWIPSEIIRCTLPFWNRILRRFYSPPDCRP